MCPNKIEMLFQNYGYGITNNKIEHHLLKFYSLTINLLKMSSANAMGSAESVELLIQKLDLYRTESNKMKTDIADLRLKYETAQSAKNEVYGKYTKMRERNTKYERKIANTEKLLCGSKASAECEDAYSKYIDDCKKYIAEHEINVKQCNDENILTAAQNHWFFEALRNYSNGEYVWNDVGGHHNKFEGVITLGDVTDCLERTYLDYNFGECCHKKYGIHVYIPIFHQYRPNEFAIRKPLEIIKGRIDTDMVYMNS